jgi:hypothetical protein
MLVVDIDDFNNGSAGTAITARTPSGGGSWANHPISNATLVLTNAGRARIAAAAGQIAQAYHSWTPPTADYDVVADVVRVGTPGANDLFGVCGRTDTAATTLYHARYSVPAAGWQLLKGVAGTFSVLATASATLAAGTSYRLALRMRGDQISVLVDGVQVIAPVTDTEITAAGRAGLRGFPASTDANGLHADNVVVSYGPRGPALFHSHYQNMGWR